jgi:hypothetical protein
MRFTDLLAGVSAVVLTGCTYVAVSSEHNPGADFSGLSTYDWAEPPQPVADDPHTQNPDLDARVRKAIETELTARGFTRAGNEANFLVGYHMAVERRLDVQYIDDYYGYSGYSATGRRDFGGSGRSISRRPRQMTYEYDQGTLVIDISTPESKDLIWRGSATAAIQAFDSQKKRDRRLAEAVKKVLKEFPPR